MRGLLNSFGRAALNTAGQLRDARQDARSWVQTKSPLAPLYDVRNALDDTRAGLLGHVSRDGGDFSRPRSGGPSRADLDSEARRQADGRADRMRRKLAERAWLNPIFRDRGGA